MGEDIPSYYSMLQELLRTIESYVSRMYGYTTIEWQTKELQEQIVLEKALNAPARLPRIAQIGRIQDAKELNHITGWYTPYLRLPWPGGSEVICCIVIYDKIDEEERPINPLYGLSLMVEQWACGKLTYLGTKKEKKHIAGYALL